MKVMETSLKVLGQEHPSTLTSMANLAYTWKSQGRDEEAIELLGRAEELQKQILGSDHHLTIGSTRILYEWQMPSETDNLQNTGSFKEPRTAAREQLAREKAERQAESEAKRAQKAEEAAKRKREADEKRVQRSQAKTAIKKTVVAKKRFIDEEGLGRPRKRLRATPSQSCK